MKRGNREELYIQVEIDEDTQFEAPEYENGNEGLGDDYRSTLYWLPKIEIGSNGSSKVVYYNSNLISNVKGKIYFVPAIGQASFFEFEYTIK